MEETAEGVGKKVEEICSPPTVRPSTSPPVLVSFMALVVNVLPMTHAERESIASRGGKGEDLLASHR